MAADTRIGTEVAGYRIESPLGHGGMSVVYLAEDLRLGRKVALKLLTPQLAESERFRGRFLRESRVAASIDHPNIIPIYDAGEADGTLYIAMRYVEGTDLRALIREEGPLDPERTLAIVTQVAAALDAAHAHGLVHRDVKPGNVLLVPRSSVSGSDHVYLTDFGLTKRAMSVSGVTETGQLIGTIDYVAPEQIRGDQVDGRADVYSLGCVLYECLTGRAPFTRDLEVAVLWAHVQDPIPSVTAIRSDVPVEVDGVIERALAKTPEERTQTGEALVADLRSALGYETAPGGVVRVREARRRGRLRRRRGLLAAAVALAGLAVAVAVFLVVRGGTAPLIPAVNTVARIDASSRSFAEAIPVGGDPTGVAVDDKAVWVINLSDSTVTRIDPATGKSVATKSTLGTPTGLAVGEGAVWITNGFGSQAGSAQVVRVNPADDHVERAFGSPNAHAIAAAFGSVWLADPSGDRVLRYDATSYERTAAIRLDDGASPSFLAVGTGAASGIWVANPLANTVVRIDAKTDRIVDSFGVDAPTAVAATDEGVWVTSNATDTVVRIDPRTGSRIVTLSLEANGIPNGPSNVVVAPTGVWVSSNMAALVVRIDPATNQVVERLEVHGISDALAVAPDGGVWVTVHRQ